MPYIELLTALRILDPIPAWVPSHNHLNALTHVLVPDGAGQLHLDADHTVLTLDDEIHLVTATLRSEVEDPCVAVLSEGADRQGSERLERSTEEAAVPWDNRCRRVACKKLRSASLHETRRERRVCEKVLGEFPHTRFLTFPY